MDKKNLVETYHQLGFELSELASSIEKSIYTPDIHKAIANNAWFSIETIKTSLHALANSLNKNNIENWLEPYRITKPLPPKNIGIIMAGNIPLVGFHDLVCCLISGNNVLCKLSSKDQFLYSIIRHILIKLDPSFETRIKFTDGTLKEIDAIIATGSDNSARYFEYYFNKYPNIIRKNRNSIAILTGNETREDFEKLGCDIFTYFGLGCRNVSTLLVPENYNYTMFFEGIQNFSEVANHNKYINNYDYQKTLLLMHQIKFQDNGFVLLKNDNALSSPISVIHIQQYNSTEEIENIVEFNKNKIQCIVSKTKWSFKTYGLGEAQKPELWDYADNIDTLNFLINLK